MKRIFIIAQHDFLAVVTRQSYIFATITLPFILGLGLIVLQAKTATDEPAATAGAVGVIDQAGLLGPAATAPDRLQSDPNDASIRRYDNLDYAINDLKEGSLDILYVFGPQYLQTGEIDTYGRETRHLRGNSPTGYSGLSEHVRGRLLRMILPEYSSEMTSDAASRLITPARLKKLSVRHDGTVEPLRNPWERISSVLAPLSVAFLLGLSVYLSSGILLEATVEEGKNRVLELLLSSVTVDQLLWGKVLGLVGAGLLQVISYLVLILLATIYLWVGIDVSPATLAGYLIYWMLGHLLYAALLLVTGILFGGGREGHQLTVIWLFTAMFPLFFAETLLYAPDGLLARAFSYIPLTAPVAVVFRISRTSVPPIDIIVSLAILIVSIYLVMRGAAKVLRTGFLMYGKRFTLPEVARWLREA